MKRLVLPARAYGRKLVYEFRNISNKGGSFKIFLRNELKKIPEYHTPVEMDSEVAGRTEDGVPIPINTLGRWMFVVPGYAGNAVFYGFSNPCRVIVNINISVQPEVVEIIDRLFSAVGGVRIE